MQTYNWIELFRVVKEVEGTTLMRVIDWGVKFDNKEIYSLCGQRDGKCSGLTNALKEAISLKFPFLEFNFNANLNDTYFNANLNDTYFVGMFSTKNILPQHSIEIVGTMRVPGDVNDNNLMKYLETQNEFTNTIIALNGGLKEILELCGYSI